MITEGKTKTNVKALADSQRPIGGPPPPLPSAEHPSEILRAVREWANKQVVSAAEPDYRAAAADVLDILDRAALRR